MIFDRFFKNNKEEDTNLPDQDKTIKTTDYYTVGVDKFNQSDYKAALEYFQAAISEHPDRENAYLKLAESYWALGKQKDAVSALYKLLSQYPDNTRAKAMLVQYQPPQVKEKPEIKITISNTVENHVSSSSNQPFDPHSEPSGFIMPDINLLDDSNSIQHPLKTILQSPEYTSSTAELPIVMGVNDSGRPYIADIAEMPNLLISGMTGYGKTTFLNTMLLSLLYKKHPADLKLVIVGDRRLSLTPWEELSRHYLAAIPDNNQPVIIDKTDLAIKTMNTLCTEMDLRYQLFKKANVRNIKDYNYEFCQRKLNPYDGHDYMPYIVVVFYEFASVICNDGRDIETPICKLTQLAKAVGIHVVIASNRSDVDVFSTQMKTNFPARLSFKAARGIESNAILGLSGAQNLKTAGEMLYSVAGSTPMHLNGAYVSDDNIDKVIRFISKQRGFSEEYQIGEYLDYNNNQNNGFDPNLIDPLFEEAARIVVQTQYGSTSMIQRKLKLGYNRAGRIMEQLEAAKIVGPFSGSKQREVLFQTEFRLEMYLRDLFLNL